MFRLPVPDLSGVSSNSSSGGSLELFRGFKETADALPAFKRPPVLGSLFPKNNSASPRVRRSSILRHAEYIEDSQPAAALEHLPSPDLADVSISSSDLNQAALPAFRKPPILGNLFAREDSGLTRVRRSSVLRHVQQIADHQEFAASTPCNRSTYNGVEPNSLCFYSPITRNNKTGQSKKIGKNNTSSTRSNSKESNKSSSRSSSVKNYVEESVLRSGSVKAITSYLEGLKEQNSWKKNISTRSFAVKEKRVEQAQVQEQEEQIKSEEFEEDVRISSHRRSVERFLDNFDKQMNTVISISSTVSFENDNTEKEIPQIQTNEVSTTTTVPNESKPARKNKRKKRSILAPKFPDTFSTKFLQRLSGGFVTLEPILEANDEEGVRPKRERRPPKSFVQTLLLPPDVLKRVLAEKEKRKTTKSQIRTPSTSRDTISETETSLRPKRMRNKSDTDGPFKKPATPRRTKRTKSVTSRKNSSTRPASMEVANENAYQGDADAPKPTRSARSKKESSRQNGKNAASAEVERQAPIQDEHPERVQDNVFMQISNKDENLEHDVDVRPKIPPQSRTRKASPRQNHDSVAFMEDECQIPVQDENLENDADIHVKAPPQTRRSKNKKTNSRQNDTNATVLSVEVERQAPTQDEDPESDTDVHDVMRPQKRRSRSKNTTGAGQNDVLMEIENKIVQDEIPESDAGVSFNVPRGSVSSRRKNATSSYQNNTNITCLEGENEAFTRNSNPRNDRDARSKTSPQNRTLRSRKADLSHHGLVCVGDEDLIPMQDENLENDVDIRSKSPQTRSNKNSINSRQNDQIAIEVARHDENLESDADVYSKMPPQRRSSRKRVDICQNEHDSFASECVGDTRQSIVYTVVDKQVAAIGWCQNMSSSPYEVPSEDIHIKYTLKGITTKCGTSSTGYMIFAPKYRKPPQVPRNHNVFYKVEKGEAIVRLNGKKKLLKEYGEFHIPLGCEYTITNLLNAPLVLHFIINYFNS